MKTLLGLAIAGSLLGAGSAGAFTISDPASGASDLILFINDVTAGTTYARDTGIAVSSIYNATTNSLVGSPNGTLLAADANLTTYLGTIAAGDQVQWAVEGGAWNGTGSDLRATGKEAIVTTQGIPGLGQINKVLQNGLNGQMVNFATEVAVLNSFGMLDATGSTHETGVKATSGDGVWGGPNGVNGDTTWYGVLNNSGLPLNQSTALYGLTGNGKGGGSVFNALLATLSLDAKGNLIASGNGGGTSPVPLPAAIWVFGSGLLGLFGIGRRRTANA